MSEEKAGREWVWADENATSGVHTYEGQLVWWSRPHGLGGHLGEVAADQSFDDFLASGPRVDAPADVVRAVRAHLAARRGLQCSS